ncbi:hypothetical protein [Amycolatopsis orientalis]|uniref:hypothetical protein n=1 Tax=Amycolatopsis orientalis TaxID=31958 RepID=UPI0003A7924E|nr:hypothetical protein [Amycolatopsis orientalis]
MVLARAIRVRVVLMLVFPARVIRVWAAPVWAIRVWAIRVWAIRVWAVRVLAALVLAASVRVVWTWVARVR